MTQYAFSIDTTRCTGCKTCEMACKDYKDLGVEYTIRRVFDYEGGDWTQGENGGWTTTSFIYHIPVSCNHCDNPACVEACPTGAMAKDPETGIVSVDTEVCIACGSCEASCPYGAPHIDDQVGHSVKCDGCADRLAEGKQPMCVDACVMRALDFGPVEEIVEQGDRADVAPLPDPSNTMPNFFIKKAGCTKPVDDESGHVANPLEVA